MTGLKKPASIEYGWGENGWGEKTLKTLEIIMEIFQMLLVMAAKPILFKYKLTH